MRIHIQTKHRQLLIATGDHLVEEAEEAGTFVQLGGGDLTLVPSDPEYVYEEESTELGSRAFGFRTT